MKVKDYENDQISAQTDQTRLVEKIKQKEKEIQAINQSIKKI